MAGEILCGAGIPVLDGTTVFVLETIGAHMDSVHFMTLFGVLDLATIHFIIHFMRGTGPCGQVHTMETTVGEIRGIRETGTTIQTTIQGHKVQTSQYPIQAEV
jgi:hypothetical protein